MTFAPLWMENEQKDKWSAAIKCYYIAAVQDPILATTHISDTSDPAIFSPIDNMNHENVPEISKELTCHTSTDP